MPRNLLTFAAFLLVSVRAFAGIGPAETVVLVNSKSAASRRVAAHYAKARQIPAANVCEVACDASLETDMTRFVADVVDPLREFLRRRGAEKRITAVVLTQGMPIVAKTPTGAVSTAAALSLLDTEMCGQPQTRFPELPNPYRAGPAPVAPIGAGDGRFLLVTALVSTTEDEAIALVDRSVAADGTAPAGARFVFQDADGAAGVRNAGYDAARAELETAGFTTEHLAQERGAPAFVGRRGVMGFMSGGSYSQLTPESVASNAYLPGALCDMLQSFGAVPVNFLPDQKGSQFPVTHMIRAGITGVHGAVAEPYNIAFPDVRLFDPYVRGFTLAESFHQSMPYVYWMNLTIGDPLCAPYAKRIVPTVKLGPLLLERGAAIDVEAPGAVRIDVYVDGRPAGTVEGDRGTVRADLALFAGRGEREVLVESTGPGPAEPRGWTTTWSTVAAAVETAPPAAPRVTFDRLVIESPATVVAGEIFEVRALAADGKGAAVAAWKGRVEMRSAVPPVRWARADAVGPGVAMQCLLRKAGDYALDVVAPDDGRTAKVKVTVVAAPFHHATCPASTFPLRQECDLDVVLEDRFGNRVASREGTIELSVPGDGAAVLPPPLRDPAGRSTFSDVVLTKPGDCRLVLTDGTGARVSANDEGVKVVRGPIRPWLVAGPVPAKAAFAAEPAVAGATAGAAVAGRTLLRRADADVLRLPPGDAKRAEAAVLVTYLHVSAPTAARLLGAAAGRVRVFLDGKAVFDGAPKAADPRGRREPLADLALATGVHRLTVVTETRGAAEVSFEIDDGKDAFPEALVVRARPGEAK